MKRAEEKTKKLQNSPKWLTILKSFAVPEPLNILHIKTRALNPEGDNNYKLITIFYYIYTIVFYICPKTPSDYFDL